MLGNNIQIIGFKTIIILAGLSALLNDMVKYWDLKNNIVNETLLRTLLSTESKPFQHL